MQKGTVKGHGTWLQGALLRHRLQALVHEHRDDLHQVGELAVKQ